VKTTRRKVYWYGGVCCVIAILWLASPRCAPRVRLPEDLSKLSDGSIVRLLRQEIEDEANWDMRNNYPVPHNLWAFGLACWERRFPVSYSEERIVALGTVAVAPLLRLVASSDDPRVVTKAAYILAYFDDPRILPAFYQAAKRGRVSPPNLQWLLEIHLPVGPMSTGVKDADVIKWLGDRLDEDYSVLRLALLDTVVTAEYEGGGMFPGVADRRIVRWLDRIYDDDLDERLAASAPGALAFRDAELKKGRSNRPGAPCSPSKWLEQGRGNQGGVLGFTDAGCMPRLAAGG
jgi:hypothetical protein